MAVTIIVNASIHTLDPDRPRASALAIAGDEIVASGSDDGVRAFTERLTAPGESPEVLDLHGRTVLPGLVDSHVHFAGVARHLREVDCETETLDECLRRIAERAAVTPSGGWIVGGGWNQNSWRAFPAAADLDRVTLGHPAYLISKSWHAAWVNSRALQIAGVGRDTVSPAGGEVQRDVAGTPTGILLERAAMRLVGDVVPRESPEELATLMQPAMEHAWRAGLTGIHCFDGDEALAAYVRLVRRRELGLRVVKMILAGEHEAALEAGLRSGAGDDWLRIGNLKVMADGALGQRTALMFEPYTQDIAGAQETTGIVVTGKDELRELAFAAVTNGLAMGVHAIGDRANHDVLDVIEAVRAVENGLARRARDGSAAATSAGAESVATNEAATNGAAGSRPTTAPAGRLRHRIEHVQLIRPSDLSRLAALDVVASMQPIHATSDMTVAERLWGERCAHAYALRDVLSTGASLAFGSDAPVESLNPFWGLHAAVTRRRADGSPGPDGWYPAQRLSVGEALRGFTLGAAFAGLHERRTGSLEPGKLADLVVCDRDIFTGDPMDIRDTHVLGTMVGGIWRYRGDELT